MDRSLKPAQLVLKKWPKGRLRLGHPWVYRSQIQMVNGAHEGGLVDVLSSGGRFLGRGYWNPRSEISARFLSRQSEPIDKEFFKRRLAKAVELRKRWVRDTNAYRLVSSEGDDLPGLIVDRYDEVLVVQFLTKGMEGLKPLVLEALKELVPVRGIYERSDSSSRRLEGLPERQGWIERSCGADLSAGSVAEVIVHERDVRYALALGEGHKTGFYLDQRENRFALRDLGLRGEALDVFCFSGGFGLHLAKAGMKVLGVDAQAEAVAQARHNAQLNGLSEDQVQFVEANAFDLLKSLEKAGRHFELVVLDPPSFAKKKDALEGALAGYKELCLRSMRLLGGTGLLAVFTCSYHLGEDLLAGVCMEAAADVHRTLRLVRHLKQGMDHPINPFIPETYYLKGFLWEVV